MGNYKKFKRGGICLTKQASLVPKLELSNVFSKRLGIKLPSHFFVSAPVTMTSMLSDFASQIPLFAT